MITLLNKISLKARHIVLYGLVLAAMVFALKWLQWKFLVVDLSIEMYVGIIAVIFTVLGAWIATKLVSHNAEKVVVKEVIVPPPGGGGINETRLNELDLSEREYEVLQLMAKGYSNAEIAESLFLSVNTIKTHVSNLFVKMNVESRTRAVVKAKDMGIVR